VTGHDIDGREASFGKLQFQWIPSAPWSVRLILDGERDRDGDFALGDLAAIRDRPHHVQRDFEGFAHRDIFAPTLLVERQGDVADFSMISGLVDWKTRNATDLDYSPQPAVTRDSTLKDEQFTEEFRLASPAEAPLALTDRLKLKWQTGVLLFSQNYREDSINHYAPFVLDPTLAAPVDETTPPGAASRSGRRALLADHADGLGRTSISTAGLRGDYEHKKADLLTSFSPQIAPDADGEHRPRTIPRSRRSSDWRIVSRRARPLTPARAEATRPAASIRCRRRRRPPTGRRPVGAAKPGSS